MLASPSFVSCPFRACQTSGGCHEFRGDGLLECIMSPYGHVLVNASHVCNTCLRKRTPGFCSVVCDVAIFGWLLPQSFCQDSGSPQIDGDYRGWRILGLAYCHLNYGANQPISSRVLVRWLRGSAATLAPPVRQSWQQSGIVQCGLKHGYSHVGVFGNIGTMVGANAHQKTLTSFATQASSMLRRWPRNWASPAASSTCRAK